MLNLEKQIIIPFPLKDFLNEKTDKYDNRESSKNLIDGTKKIEYL